MPRVVAGGVALASVVGFYDLGTRYNDFRYPQGPSVGDYQLPAQEVAFYGWYALLGLTAAIALTVALATTTIPARLGNAFERLACNKWFLPAAAVLFLLEVLACKHLVLEYAPISGDESAYVFIARTLADGRVMSPLPDGDLEFFRNTFIVFSDQGWYGKYPIGHPLLLAIGELVGLRWLVVPLIGVGVLLLTHAVGRQLLGDKQAALAVCLLLLSPQHVMTAATELSQPSCALAMMLGLWTALKGRGTDGSWSPRWIIASGLCWGFAVLVRPMPGVLFVLVLLGWVLAGWKPLPLPDRIKVLALASIGCLVYGALLLWVNHQQSGSALESGYQTQHDMSVLDTRSGHMSNSLFGAAIRQNAWLFGWPLSFAFVPFALGWTGKRTLAPLWLLVAAGYSYRLLFPKVMVGTTGPIYVAELVPLFALLTAAGATVLYRRAAKRDDGLGRWVPSAVISMAAVSLLLFDVIAVRDTHRIGHRHQTVYRLLKRVDMGKTLVFTNQLIFMGAGKGWAMTPPAPSPQLDDEVVFVRRLTGPGAAEHSVAFWQRRFAARTAFTVEITPDGRTGLRQLLSAEDFPDYPFEFYARQGTYGVPIVGPLLGGPPQQSPQP